ncbi:polysaccharide deacetylase family protein [Paenibacillus chartarius]|uniref:Polysaccharide deacetylase family protein n=1 Tax=Paenibacillus chartarius TaxID=747481 RepID=A0ABV6DSR7_9BACL
MRSKWFILAAMFAAVWFALDISGSVDEFIRETKGEGGDPSSRSSSRQAFGLQSGTALDNDLETRIREEAKRTYIAPIDAKVDRVWKAIPGYNGLEVDIEQSLKLASMQPMQDPLPIVTREIPPNISLDDLGAHPIYKGNPKKPMAALMINVAWGDEFLPGMLETLRKENVHATFFFDGSWLSTHLETAKQIGAQGHELSNHAYSHKNMSRLSAAQARSEIAKTETLLKDKLGVSNRWFAPPSGDYDQETVRIAAEQGLKTVLWTLDTVDWTNPGGAVIVRKIGTRVEPGSLILMHPTKSSSDALEGMIRAIRAKNLKLGTVSEVLSSDRVDGPEK